MVIRSHSWSLVVTRGHSWSLVVTRGHSWSLVCTFRQDRCLMLRDNAMKEYSFPVERILNARGLCMNLRKDKQINLYVHVLLLKEYNLVQRDQITRLNGNVKRARVPYNFAN